MYSYHRIVRARRPDASTATVPSGFLRLRDPSRRESVRSVIGIVNRREVSVHGVEMRYGDASSGTETTIRQSRALPFGSPVASSAEKAAFTVIGSFVTTVDGVRVHVDAALASDHDRALLSFERAGIAATLQTRRRRDALPVLLRLREDPDGMRAVIRSSAKTRTQDDGLIRRRARRRMRRTP